MTVVPAPQVGDPFAWGEAVIVPTYVRESEVPRQGGACVTADLTDPSTFKPAGWYVEYHPAHRVGDRRAHYRDFIPYSAARVSG